MEKNVINVLPSVIDYLDELIIKLYENEYFGFLESAETYVSNIYDFIPELIENQKHKQAPAELQKHGQFYISYSSNKRTNWYIFFNRRDNRFLIKYITNNHMPDAKFL